MIKLINLLELNINNSRITPELVNDYFIKNIYNLFLEQNMPWKLYKKLCVPYCEKYDIYEWVGGETEFEKLSYPDLVQIYKEMQDLVESNQINELGINKPKSWINPRDLPDDPYYNPKVYRAIMNNGEEFTIHKHKNHYNLYPSFDKHSLKYQRIKQFLNSKNIQYTETLNSSNGKSIVNVRIPLNQIRT